MRWEEVCGTSLLLQREKREIDYSLLQLNVAEFETDVLIGGQADILRTAKQDEKYLHLG